MNYFTITSIIMNVLLTLLGLLTVHFVIFAFIGLFTRKTFPKTDKKLKYGIIIPARNEETVVCNLIESIYKCNYPQEKLHVFVIAHNCTDKTAEVARKTNATVYEYNNPNECTMGYAFRYLFDRINEDYGTENYDGFFLFNADNVLDKEYFDKMNDAFVACDKKSVITSFRNSKNFGSNTMSALYGLYFAGGCRLESRGRTVCGCSTRVQGTGYVINSEIVKDGWKYVTLTEDWEFTSDQILNDTPVVYCDDAMFYDEQPTDIHIMWRQRVRWAKGHLLVCITRLKDLIKGIFRSKKNGGNKRKFSAYDISVNILPVCIISAVLTIVQHILYLFSPLFGESIADVYLRMLPSMLINFAITYVLTALSGLLIYILERKRIPHVRLSVKILSVLLWPLFVLVAIPMEIVALFSKNLGWKPIPHTDTTDFDKLNETPCGEPERKPVGALFNEDKIA